MDTKDDSPFVDISDLTPQQREAISEPALQYVKKLRQQARTERLTRADRKWIADLKAKKT